MITLNRKPIAALVVALASSAALYAAAQQPAPAAPQRQPGPPAQAGAPHDHQHGGGNQAGGGMGQKGMMMGGEEMSCPMMNKADANVTVEKTKAGAVVRLSAKDPAKVADVQRMALMMALHLGADPGAMMPPGQEGRPAAKP